MRRASATHQSKTETLNTAPGGLVNLIISDLSGKINRRFLKMPLDKLLAMMYNS